MSLTVQFIDCYFVNLSSFNVPNLFCPVLSFQVLSSLNKTGSQVPALQAQLADKTEQLARAEQKVRDATLETERYKEQLTGLSARVQETTSESFRQLKDEIQRKDNQIHRLKLEADELRVQLLSRASLIKDLEKKHEALKHHAAEIAHAEAVAMKKLEDKIEVLQNERYNNADERGDLSVENSRLVEALQQARNRIHKLEAAAEDHDSDVAARLQNVRNAEEKVCVRVRFSRSVPSR